MGRLFKLSKEVTIPYENDKSILIKVEKDGAEITTFLPKKMYNFKDSTHYLPDSREVVKCRFTKGNDVKDVEVDVAKFIETFGVLVDPEVPEIKVVQEELPF